MHVSINRSMNHIIITSPHEYIYLAPPIASLNLSIDKLARFSVSNRALHLQLFNIHLSVYLLKWYVKTIEYHKISLLRCIQLPLVLNLMHSIF